MRIDRSTFLWIPVLSFAFAGAFAFGCSSTSDGGVENGNDADASTAADEDASDSIANNDARARDAQSETDSGTPLQDAAIPPFDAASLPPALAACGTCLSGTCEPAVSNCAADVYCEDLLTCALESGCIQSGGSTSTCISSCANDAGLTPKETAEATKLLEQMVTDCSSCVAQCPKPDAG